MENFYRNKSDKTPRGFQSPVQVELVLSLEQSDVIAEMLTDPSWPNSHLIPISFTFKTTGFSILN